MGFSSDLDDSLGPVIMRVVSRPRIMTIADRGQRLVFPLSCFPVFLSVIQFVVCKCWTPIS